MTKISEAQHDALQPVDWTGFCVYGFIMACTSPASLLFAQLHNLIMNMGMA